MSAGGLSLVGGDAGDVNMSVDPGAGIIRISIRPPLALESARVSADIPILDFLDKAADLTKMLNQMQRDVLAQLRNQAKT